MDYDYVVWESNIVRWMENNADLTHGDAMGIVEAHEAIVANGWTKGLSPKTVAEQLLA